MMKVRTQIGLRQAKGYLQQFSQGWFKNIDDKVDFESTRLVHVPVHVYSVMVQMSYAGEQKKIYEFDFHKEETRSVVVREERDLYFYAGKQFDPELVNQIVGDTDSLYKPQQEGLENWIEECKAEMDVDDSVENIGVSAKEGFVELNRRFFARSMAIQCYFDLIKKHETEYVRAYDVSVDVFKVNTKLFYFPIYVTDCKQDGKVEKILTSGVFRDNNQSVSHRMLDQNRVTLVTLPAFFWLASILPFPVPINGIFAWILSVGPFLRMFGVLDRFPEWRDWFNKSVLYSNWFSQAHVTLENQMNSMYKETPKSIQNYKPHVTDSRNEKRIQEMKTESK